MNLFPQGPSTFWQKQRLVLYNDSPKSWEVKKILEKEAMEKKYDFTLLIALFISQSTGSNVLSMSYPSMIACYWYVSVSLVLAIFQEIGWEFGVDVKYNFSHLNNGI